MKQLALKQSQVTLHLKVDAALSLLLSLCLCHTARTLP